MSLSIPEQDVDSDSFSVSTLGRSSPLYRVSSNGSRNAAKALGGTSGISPADHEEATLRKSCRSPSRTPTTVSQSEGYEAGTTTIRRPAPAEDRLSCPPSSCRSWKAALRHSWSRNKGVALVLLSQFFGALMNVTTRLLETDGDGMHPLQVLFARMSITLLFSCVYMWYMSVPDFPLGKPEIRGLLAARGFGGFFGVFGLYYSLAYLPIADAIVITFLAPTVACWACSVFINEPFTRVEQLAGLISLLGVVLIARPVSLFSESESPTVGSGATDGIPVTGHPSNEPSGLQVTPTQRLIAVGVAMLGVLGAACAYTTIRWIGKRAHPLISVSYFALWCTIVSTVSLLAIPDIGFRFPASLKEWSYLGFLGTSGFIMQVLLTAGLQQEKSSRATNMVYTQMLFALALDKLVWGTIPTIISLVGSSLILGSAIYVAVQKEGEKKNNDVRENIGQDEELGLLTDVHEEDGRADGDNERRGAAAEEPDMPLRSSRV